MSAAKWDVVLWHLHGHLDIDKTRHHCRGKGNSLPLGSDTALLECLTPRDYVNHLKRGLTDRTYKFYVHRGVFNGWYDNWNMLKTHIDSKKIPLDQYQKRLDIYIGTEEEIMRRFPHSKGPEITKPPQTKQTQPSQIKNKGALDTPQLNSAATNSATQQATRATASISSALVYDSEDAAQAHTGAPWSQFTTRTTADRPNIAVQSKTVEPSPSSFDTEESGWVITRHHLHQGNKTVIQCYYLHLPTTDRFFSNLRRSNAMDRLDWKIKVKECIFYIPKGPLKGLYQTWDQLTARAKLCGLKGAFREFEVFVGTEKDIDSERACKPAKCVNQDDVPKHFTSAPDPGECQAISAGSTSTAPSNTRGASLIESKQLANESMTGSNLPTVVETLRPQVALSITSTSPNIAAPLPVPPQAQPSPVQPFAWREPRTPGGFSDSGDESLAFPGLRSVNGDFWVESIISSCGSIGTSTKDQSEVHSSAEEERWMFYQGSQPGLSATDISGTGSGLARAAGEGTAASSTAPSLSASVAMRQLGCSTAVEADSKGESAIPRLTTTAAQVKLDCAPVLNRNSMIMYYFLIDGREFGARVDRWDGDILPTYETLTEYWIRVLREYYAKAYKTMHVVTAAESGGTREIPYEEFYKLYQGYKWIPRTIWIHIRTGPVISLEPLRTHAIPRSSTPMGNAEDFVANATCIDGDTSSMPDDNKRDDTVHSPSSPSETSPRILYTDDSDSEDGSANSESDCADSADSNSNETDCGDVENHPFADLDEGDGHDSTHELVTDGDEPDSPHTIPSVLAPVRHPVAKPAVIMPTVSVDSGAYLDSLIASPSNTTASSRLLQILKAEDVKLDSALGLKLLDLADALCQDGELGPPKPSPPVELAGKISDATEARFDLLTRQLAVVAKVIGVDLERVANDDAGDSSSENEQAENKGSTENDKEDGGGGVDVDEVASESTSDDNHEIDPNLMQEMATTNRQVLDSINNIKSPYAARQPELSSSPERPPDLNDVLKGAQELDHESTDDEYETYEDDRQKGKFLASLRRRESKSQPDANMERPSRSPTEPNSAVLRRSYYPCTAQWNQDRPNYQMRHAYFPHAGGPSAPIRHASNDVWVTDLPDHPLDFGVRSSRPVFAPQPAYPSMYQPFGNHHGPPSKNPPSQFPPLFSSYNLGARSGPNNLYPPGPGTEWGWM
ncbi:hypothetical protein CI109_102887 [Kwoniella shandongensis]|uniref:Uncharacterized protein n=1 Tax=Kwoniella shandongensis TaxID=1734106 RepID=A0A5M6C7W8_9TREE|nr:uncharacterized protein CI109_000077 [Kwoniella shandongensis]KAA5531237.1 hypothetical protein CI109_000077 [Kwoniella shandongensis]